MVTNFNGKKLLDQTKENIREANKAVISQTAGFISSAFVLVAALAWNDTIKELISRYFSAGDGLASRLAYTFIVTLIAILVTSRLTKLAQKFKDQPPQEPKK